MKSVCVKFFCWFLAFWLVAFSAQAQLREDRKAEQLWIRGKSLFENGEYGLALAQFEDVLERRFNLLTTPALYMSGLCFYHLDDPQRGVERFQKLLNDYPLSMYAEEASYHKALLMLRLPEGRLGGLYLLTQLIQQANAPGLMKDARNAYLNYLHNEADADFLIEYYEVIRPRPEFRFLVHEALCYRLYKEGRHELLTHMLDEYRKERGNLNDRLTRLVVKAPEGVKVRQVRVALLMPFNTQSEAQLLPQLSLWSQELLGGMRLALEELRDSLGANIDLKVLDTRENADRTKELVQKELEAFKPDLIVGDLLNGPSKTISEYAEKNKTIQVIPLSPVEELIKGKKYVYLANPSMPLQIRSLARYGIQQLKSTRFLVIGDGTGLSNRQVKEFTAVLKDSGFSYLEHSLSENYDLEYRRLRGVISQMKSQSIETVFIASDNESMVAFLLKQFEADNIVVRVLGSSDWHRFEVIERRLLVLYDATFACTYYAQNDPEAFSAFAEKYRQQYRHAPGMPASLGYDICRFFLGGRFRQPDGSQWKEAIRKAKPWRGLNQNYYYAGGQDNQSVQFLQYRESGLEKVKMW